jgi:hypothetical protein
LSFIVELGSTAQGNSGRLCFSHGTRRYERLRQLITGDCGGSVQDIDICAVIVQSYGVGVVADFCTAGYAKRTGGKEGGGFRWMLS